MPTTPEQLMRSRYCAFALVDIDYIQETMRDAALKKFDYEDTRAWTAVLDWFELQVISSDQTGDVGFVEFIAKCKNADAVVEQLHERSKFKRYNGRWYYVNSVRRIGQDQALPKLGRNDPCYCGSDKKFKKCCGG